ncbi:MAG: metallophosphoesterase [Bacteroidaceae bacterium]
MILISILILLLIITYVCRHLWTLLPLQAPWRIVIISFCTLLLLLLIISFVWGEQMPLTASRWIYRISTAWCFIFFYLIMVFLLIDLTGLILPKIRPLFQHQWSSTLGLIALITGIFIYGNIHYHHPVRVPLHIKLQKPLPHPLKIVAISDLHLGYTIGSEEAAQWVKQINNEKPDIILIAGDIADYSIRPLLHDSIACVLNKLRAPLGIYACMGNHDYIANANRTIPFIKSTGIHLLRDEAILVDSAIYIVGRDDRSNPHRKPIKEILKGLNTNKPLILLDHQPYHLEEAANAGVDFQFSGHTHRGQVFPINLITDAIYEKSHGYLKKGNTNIYVSSGLGIWGGKFRIGSQSEYVVINLQGRQL